MTDEVKKDKIVIHLKKDPALHKDGTPVRSCNKPDCPERSGGVCKTGDIQYKQEDIQGLFNLIGRYDNTKHPGAMKIYKSLISVRDKIETAMVQEKDEINLTLDEASWLKTYLNEITDKEASNNPLRQFEIRTLVTMLEQLD